MHGLHSHHIRGHHGGLAAERVLSATFISDHRIMFCLGKSGNEHGAMSSRASHVYRSSRCCKEKQIAILIILQSLLTLLFKRIYLLTRRTTSQSLDIYHPIAMRG
ncbi:unnamed protein product, partial [Ixodes pacificus]